MAGAEVPALAQSRAPHCVHYSEYPGRDRKMNPEAGRETPSDSGLWAWRDWQPGHVGDVQARPRQFGATLSGPVVPLLLQNTRARPVLRAEYSKLPGWFGLDQDA